VKNFTIILIMVFSGYANAGVLWDYAKGRTNKGGYCKPTSVGCVSGKQTKPAKQNGVSK